MYTGDTEIAISSKNHAELVEIAQAELLKKFCRMDED